MQKIKPAQPEDALLIYFSGHGTARCLYDKETKRENCDRFYLIPHDGFAGEKEKLYAASVSDEELEAALETVDAGKLLMVIDACNSGQALDSSEEKRRGPMNSRGLAQLAYEKGMYILTASQSRQAALEATKFGHGLLTAALLEGLLKGEKNQNNEIVERSWLDYAVNQVPQFQLEVMQARYAENQKLPPEKRKEIVIRGIEHDEEANLPPDKRGLQTPRIFYRRELEFLPLIVAKH